MDLVDYEQEPYDQVLKDFGDFASRLDNVTELTFVPISALKGDNVVERSENMTWYKGPSLLYHLETVYVGSDANHVDARFPSDVPFSAWSSMSARPAASSTSFASSSPRTWRQACGKLL